MILYKEVWLFFKRFIKIETQNIFDETILQQFQLPTISVSMLQYICYDYLYV